MAEPTPQDQIRRITSTVVDVKALVDRLDPTRYEPSVEYRFNNGRKFRRPQR